MVIGRIIDGLFGDRIPDDWGLFETKKEIKAAISTMEPQSRRTAEKLSEKIITVFAGYDRRMKKERRSQVTAMAENNITAAYLQMLAEMNQGKPALDQKAQMDLLNSFLLKISYWDLVINSWTYLPV